jgi:hypothetical protein
LKSAICRLSDGGIIPGLSDLIPENRDLSDKDIEQLADVVDRADLPFDATLGLRDTRASLVRSYSRRRLVRELPPGEQSLPWLEIHNPPGGTTVVRMGSSDSDEKSIGVSVFGSGFGTGRRITFEARIESEARFVCVAYSMRLKVQARVYLRESTESVEVRVLGLLGNSVEALLPCSGCGLSSAAIDDFDYLIEPFIDLRHDVAASRLTERVEVEDHASVDAGFTLPRMETRLALKATFANNATIETESMLPAGQLYQRYRRLVTAGPLHSRMWTVDE